MVLELLQLSSRMRIYNDEFDKIENALPNAHPIGSGDASVPYCLCYPTPFHKATNLAIIDVYDECLNGLAQLIGYEVPDKVNSIAIDQLNSEH